jgi:EAL domain-containing protein (putative c-di-GMP-specific phosphodiesterase class I)
MANMTARQNRLLVLDDEPDICEFIGEVGETLGFEVSLTTQAAEFRRRVASFAPSVVVLDLQMPQADGVEQLRFLGQVACKAKVLLVSGMDSRVLSTAEHLGRSLGLDMLGSQQKPIMLDALESALERALVSQRAITPADIRRGLEHREFTVYYQPKASRTAKGWVVDAVEALVRWKHPKLGLVLPDEFVSVAEEHDLIAELTDLVFRDAIENCARWGEREDPLSVAVNFSPRLLTDLDFPDRLNQFIGEFGADPTRLIVEVTESAAMIEPATTMDILTRLRVKNFGLSVDDFGTGFSSLKQLYRMPFNEIKIDSSFVREIEADPEARTIVETVVYLAHKLGMTACAEGVENQGTLDILEEIGCDRAQGYLISQPVPAEKIPEIAQDWNGGSKTGLRLAWSREEA